MNTILNTSYAFIHPDQGGLDYYLCTCGQQFSRETPKDQEDEYVMDINAQNHNQQAQDDVIALVKKAAFKTKSSITCPSCALHFHDSSLKNRLFYTDDKFLGYFSLDANKEGFKLTYNLFEARFSAGKIIIEEKSKHIKVEREGGKIFYKPIGQGEKAVDLDNLVACVKGFFYTNNPKVIDNLLSVHFSIDELCRLVIDAKNINIFQDLIGNIRNRPNYAGFEHIEKVFIIFLGIIKYSNLSTIALTKGAPFLYELMEICELPRASVLMENKLTAPVKIFNYLANSYLKKVAADVQESKKEDRQLGFEWKGKAVSIIGPDLDINTEDGELDFQVGLETTASYKINLNAATHKSSKVKNSDGEYKVYDDIVNGDISKSIYNAITNFSDYKQLIKFMKLVDKNQLINLMNKFPLELLVSAIDHLYFRHFSSHAELERVLCIMNDFAQKATLHYHPEASIANQLGLGIKYTDKADYSKLNTFSFIMYDDSKMMLDVLKFDTKRHFNKIKTWQELSDYHDNLVKFCRSITEEEKSGSIEAFAKKFSFLEDRDKYDGPLEIKILNSPSLIIKEGIEMKHSASSYSSIVAQGTYLICSIYDNDPDRPESELDRFTMGFWYNKLSGLEFHQVKGYSNELGSDRFKKLVMEYLTLVDVPFRPVKDLRLEDEV